ncbi:hypothetical protein Nepgr_019137 [Nepenthes gracilis]|uniref:Uncharacterized protein n=1 Tax=Nepenthes gracilis TaxID=150966 RepID=A0AAD3XV06_NEPGR|nr:hypothetical protein Nepgr_019137 [Nepenthes gracilis]
MAEGGGDGGDAKEGETMRIWDCGSPLYDSHELVSVSFVIERHLMVLPSVAAGSRRFKSFRRSHRRDRAAGAVAELPEMGSGCLQWSRKSRKKGEKSDKSNSFRTGFVKRFVCVRWNFNFLDE